MSKLLLTLSALSGCLAVILGAFGAHGLKGNISDNLLSAFQTGVHYHMFHTLALFGLAILMTQLSVVPKILLWSAYLWMAGIVLFSGSLYGLALGGPGWLGPVTPLGGLCSIIAWLCLAIGAWQLRV